MTFLGLLLLLFQSRPETSVAKLLKSGILPANLGTIFVDGTSVIRQVWTRHLDAQVEQTAFVRGYRTASGLVEMDHVLGRVFIEGIEGKNPQLLTAFPTRYAKPLFFGASLFCRQ
jgi:hypothetical protein